MATVRNLYIDAGSDYSTLVTVTSANGSPLDLTNFTAKSQMRKSVGSSVAYDFTAEVYDATNGKLKLSLTAAESEAIPAGRWMFDCEITNTVSGKKKRVVEGIVTVTPQITQI